MRISDWSSDVCSSDLLDRRTQQAIGILRGRRGADLDPRRVREPGFQIVAMLAARTEAETRHGANDDRDARLQIGRASCRERVCQYVSISVVAVSLKKKSMKHQ